MCVLLGTLGRKVRLNFLSSTSNMGSPAVPGYFASPVNQFIVVNP